MTASSSPYDGRGPKPTELRAYFLGRWRVERVIRGVTTMRGTCSFTPCGGALLQSEALRYQLPHSGPLEGRSQYLWEFLPGGVVQTYRSSGARRERSSFLRLAFAEGPASVNATDSHICERDRYEAEFRLLDAATFQVDYVVTGPKKQYTSTTVYRRTPPLAPASSPRSEK